MKITPPKPLFDVTIGNAWPIIVFLIGIVFSTGVIYSQIQDSKQNDNANFTRIFNLLDNSEGRLGTAEENIHTLFTVAPPKIVELYYADSSGQLNQ